jgi:hypothetical protein
MDITRARKRIDGWFPALSAIGYDPTSDEDIKYNCIAWAVGETHRRWDPAVGYHWPRGIDRNDHVDTLVEVFKSIGYKTVKKVTKKSVSLQRGVEKVAIFANGNEGTHACRQLSNGKWASKLGDFEDIEHNELAGFETCYGNAVYMMQKRSDVGGLVSFFSAMILRLISVFRQQK